MNGSDRAELDERLARVLARAIVGALRAEDAGTCGRPDGPEDLVREHLALSNEPTWPRRLVR